jgi:energy-coupling factor transport system ATP-binding protein
MQYPEYQLFDETVRADIGFALRNKGMSPEEIDQRVRRAARFVGITDDLLDKSPFDLSGGQKRRVAIAGVIAMRPGVLVLDEPTAGLDPQARESLFKNIEDYRNSTGSTVVLVTHSMDDVARIADRLIVMDHGKVVMDGTPQEVFSRPEELTEMGLTVPVATKIAMELRKRGVDIPDAIYTTSYLSKVLLARKEGNSHA